MQLVFQANMGGISVSPITQPHPKEESKMISTIKYYLRYFLTLCFIAAIAFMVACTVLVVVCAIRGDIKVNIIKSESEKEEK